MFLVRCEESRTNHLSPLLVVTMPYTCWLLWWVDYIEDFKWCCHFQLGVVFWRVVLRELYFEGPNRIWRALKDFNLEHCMWRLSTWEQWPPKVHMGTFDMPKCKEVHHYTCTLGPMIGPHRWKSFHLNRSLLSCMHWPNRKNESNKTIVSRITNPYWRSTTSLIWQNWDF